LLEYRETRMAMQLRGLRTFCLVARYLSFKEAADELCLTASAVSHQISDLETQLDCKLFERLTRSISLTEKGRQLYEQIVPHIDAIDESLEKIKASSHRVPLLVQLPEFFASELLMPIIGGFSEANEDIDLQIESMDVSGSVNNRADINIILSRKMPAGKRVEKLFPIRYMPACSQSLYEDLCSQGFSGLDALNDCTLLLHKARPNAWSRWARHAGVGNIRPRQIIYVDSMFALARAAEQGVGVALVLMPVSKAWFDSQALVPLHDIDLITEDYYWMSLSENSRKQEPVDRFWQWIIANLQHYATSERNDTMVEPDSFVA